MSKNHLRTALLIVLVLAFGVSAFLLGKVSSRSPQTKERDDIVIISSTKIRELKAGQESSQIQLKASSRGSKYYFPWCKSTFSEANTIYFKSEEEAQKAGYEKASNCVSEAPE